MWCDILFFTAAEELCVIVEWYEYLRVIEIVEVYLLGVPADDL